MATKRGDIAEDTSVVGTRRCPTKYTLIGAGLPSMALGDNCIELGDGNWTAGAFNIVIGNDNRVVGHHNVVIGNGQDVHGNHQFVMGGHLTPPERAPHLPHVSVLLANILRGSGCHSGSPWGGLTCGRNTTATGDLCCALGFDNVAQGARLAVFGTGNNAMTDDALVIGHGCNVNQPGVYVNNMQLDHKDLEAVMTALKCTLVDVFLRQHSCAK